MNVVFLKKWLLVSNMTWGILWTFTQPLKSSKISLRCAIFAQICQVCAKKYGWVIFHDTEQWCKIWINPDLVVSKMAWGIGWTFIRALKRLKNFTLTASKVEEKLTLGSKNDTWGIWSILMRAVASLNICTLMCYFCQKYIMF